MVMPVESVERLWHAVLRSSLSPPSDLMPHHLAYACGHLNLSVIT